MPDVRINKVTNASVYVNGTAFIGQAGEITLPEITQKMVEHSGLGMAGTIEIPVGIEPMEATIKWNSFYADVMKSLGVLGTAIKLQIRSNLKEYDATGGLVSEDPLVIYMTCQSKSFPLGTFRQHENVELETKLNVTAAKLEIGGEIILDYDATANIYKVGGVDQLANFRSNLGIQ